LKKYNEEVGEKLTDNEINVAQRILKLILMDFVQHYFKASHVLQLSKLMRTKSKLFFVMIETTGYLPQLLDARSLVK